MRNFFWILITFVFAPVFYLRILFGRVFKRKQLKILVIAMGKIGDLVCITPVFRAIKRKFSEAHITAGIRQQSYGVVKNNPNIDNFIFLNLEKYQGFLGRIKLIRKISKEKFYYSVNLSPYSSNTILSFLAGIPVRITSTSSFVGRTAKLFALFSDYRLEYKPHDFRLRHGLQLLRFLGIKKYSEKKQVFTTKEEEFKAEKFFKKNNIKKEDFVVGISVAVGNKFREWEPKKFSQLADRLIKELKAKIIFTGASNDKKLIEKVVGNMKNKAIISIDFKLHELAALLKKMKLFIASEAGPLYVANAVGTPVVDIVGPVDINIQPPRDKKSELVQKKIYCSPCCFIIPAPRGCKEGHLRCLKDITVNDVFVAIRRLLKRLNLCTKVKK